MFPMIVNFSHHRQPYRGMLTAAKYHNGNLAIQLMAWDDLGEYWEPYAKLSVNTDLILPPDQFVAKTYSENEGLIAQFIEAGIFEATGQVKGMGYASGPVLRTKEPVQ